jgi:HK97 family phage prohead protease
MAINLEQQQDLVPPRDNLIRGVFPVEVREAQAPGPGYLGRTLFGHLAVFDQWAEVDSKWEGHFMERMAPGSFRKTISEGRDRMKVLFNHGQDAQIANKVLGPIRDIGEDASGAFYEVPLLDTSYNRDLLPGLEAGVYGSSFRFSVPSGKEQFNRRAARSPWNPEGIPERTVLEADLKEFGPVTWPVYKGATAAVRSLTDDFIRMRFILNERGELMTDRADSPKEPYGDVEYADPGYQADKKKRYPIDTSEHVHAAWSYINKAHNAAQYNAEQLASIKGRIKAAAKKIGMEISDDSSNSDSRNDAVVDLERNADGSLIAEEQMVRGEKPASLKIFRKADFQTA